MSDANWGVYCIRNRINERVYVGTTTKFHNRIQAHKSALKLGYHYSKALQQDWVEFGEAAFEFVIIETIPAGDVAVLLAAEQRWIDELRAREPGKGYNTYPAGAPPQSIASPKPADLAATDSLEWKRRTKSLRRKLAKEGRSLVISRGPVPQMMVFHDQSKCCEAGPVHCNLTTLIDWLED